MSPNVGTLDRAARALLGIVLVLLPFVSGLALFQSVTLTIVSVVIGAVMLAVAATRVCPVYSVFGLKTCRSA